MNFIFYIFSCFPGVVLNLGFGNAPLRYILIPLLLVVHRVNKIDALFLFSILIHILYAVLTMAVRPLNALDLSYILAYLYLVLGLCVVRSNIFYFKEFVRLFWIFNVLYAFIQNILLSFNVDQALVLFHQNSHYSGYSIPESEFFDFLHRVTGFFNESAPFVIYLLMTHVAFILFNYAGIYKKINLLVIFFSGAKVGIVFIGLYMIVALLGRYKIRVLKYMLVVFFLVLASAPLLLSLIVEMNSYGSLYVRLLPMYDLLDEFSKQLSGFLLGYGFIPSAGLEGEVFDGPARGLDFFSIFIYANGMVGSVLLLLPLIYWMRFHIRDFCISDKNLLALVLFLSLVTIGSILNFQYAYLIFIIAAYEHNNKQSTLSRAI